MAKDNDPVSIEHQKLIEERDRLEQEARQHELANEIGDRNCKLSLIDRLAPRLHRAEALLNASARLSEARSELENISRDNAAQQAERAELEARLETLKARHQALQHKLEKAQDESAQALEAGTEFSAPAWTNDAAFEAASIVRAVTSIEARLQAIDSETATIASRIESARRDVIAAQAIEAEAQLIRALHPIRQTLIAAVVARARFNPSAPSAAWEIEFQHLELEAERTRQQAELLALA